MAIDTSNMALPLPTKAQTATPTSPFQSTDPTKPAIGFAQAPQVDRVEAAKAEKFAWSPNQANQGLDIGTARTMTENQRLQRTAQNQLNEQAKAEKLKVDQQIQAEDAAIAAIRSEIATLNGRMSTVKSEMTSVQGEIDRKREEVRKAEEANRNARAVAASQSVSGPIGGESIHGVNNQGADVLVRQRKAQIEAALRALDGPIEDALRRGDMAQVAALREQARVLIAERGYYVGFS